MVVTVPANSFPIPSHVDELDEAVVFTSDPRSGQLFQRIVDPGVPAKAWVVRWEGKRADLGSLLRRHYASHGLNTAFDWTPPHGTAERVVYREPPRIRYRSNLTLDARVILERAVARD